MNEQVLIALRSALALSEADRKVFDEQYGRYLELMRIAAGNMPPSHPCRVRREILAHSLFVNEVFNVDI